MAFLYIFFGVIAISATVILSTLLGLIVFTYYRRYPLRHIPSPPISNYILGHITNLGKYSRNGKILGDFALDCAKEYGHIFAVHFLWNSSVICLTPSAVKQILVTGNFPKYSSIYSNLHTVFGSRFMGNGLLSEMRTERWAQNRALFNPAFHRSYLKTCLNQFNMSSDLLIKELVGRSDGETEVVMLEELNKVGLDIIAKVAFGTDLGIYSGGSKPFIDAVTCSLRALSDSFRRPWLAYNPLPSAREYRKEVDKSCRFIRETGRQCIQSQIDMLQKGQPLSNNIIAYIIQTSSESGEGLPEMEEMLDEFVTFFMAGQETTANLLAWTLMELTQHPDIVYRLKTEIDAVIGDNGYVAFEDLSKLEYMMAVLKESLRLHPPGSGSSRVAPQNCTFDGMKIPAGTPIILFTYAMARMEEYFQNAETYDPDRFLHNGDKSASMYAYFPFSLGPRMCIGQQFALIQARVILSKLLQKFEFKWVPDQSMGLVEETTIKPKDGCKCFLSAVL
ncbi:cholesterol 24-hydroxylase-like isoform X1 [Amphiura filiformis]|uniref:cholesterol 24-hydroxylase-like isoform X1 n=1 Tax=Amphiura filiformis TaxID=82378 RepID=UPI003B20C088